MASHLECSPLRLLCQAFSSVVHATTGSINNTSGTPEVTNSADYSEDEQSGENSEKEINPIKNQAEGADDALAKAIPFADVIASGTLNTVNWEIGCKWSTTHQWGTIT